MAESGLSLGWADFKQEVGYYCGFGHTSSNWSTDQESLVEAYVHRGIRRFYSPPAINGRVHVWSFLQPTATLTTVADTATYDLPDLFGGLVGDKFTFDPTEGFSAISLVGEGVIRQKQQVTEHTGYPMFAALKLDTDFDGSSGQRFQVVFFPTPDDAYTLTYRYMALQNKLSDSYPYPLGGAHHGEAIMASCLAAAEQGETSQRGVHYQDFMELTQASVELDRQLFGVDYFGYMGDSLSEGVSGPTAITYVTYEGTLYDNRR